MQRILVTGATGTVGRQVVAQLTGTGHRVRALTRRQDAALPTGIEIVSGDLTAPETLDESLQDIDAVFLVWTAPLQSAPATLGRIARSVRRIVLLTSPHQTPHPFFQQPNPVAAMHAEMERLIKALDVEWTFLRPGMFAANCLPWWAAQIRTGGVVRWPFAAAPTAPIDERDIAAVAVRALIDPGHSRAEYVLTGPESLTQLEQVVTIGEVIGKPLRFDELSPAQARRELPFPEPVLSMLLNAWSAALGQPAYVTSTVASITGSPARSFREWVSDNSHEFGP